MDFVQKTTSIDWARRRRQLRHAYEKYKPSSAIAYFRTRPVDQAVLRQRKYTPPAQASDLVRMAVAETRKPFIKVGHYFSIYEKALGEIAAQSRAGKREQPIRILEIGVWKGGSLELWRHYFGPDAVIFGIDIEPQCEELSGVDAQVRIGSQADPTFLRSVVEEMGGVDIVIDDGSHRSQHIIASLNILFPVLNQGGIYIIEDLHASYWPLFGGGLRRRRSAIEVLKNLVDELNSPYFKRRAQRWPTAVRRKELVSIEFFDSVAILRKNDNPAPDFFENY